MWCCTPNQPPAPAWWTCSPRARVPPARAVEVIARRLGVSAARLTGSPTTLRIMLKESPDHHDADLILRIYDLRREPVMRESRYALNRDFWPRTAEEVLDVLRPDHPLNTAWRQAIAYWEMVYSMARHGIVHGEFLVENNAEGLLLFTRVEPWLAELRAATSPRTLRNSEWVATETEIGRAIMTTFRARVARALAAK